MRRALKRNDGYVLPYVLGVFLVLSFAAVSICGLSLDNLRAQEASVQQTQALYEAEGKIEQVVAQVMKLKGESSDHMTALDAEGSAANDFWSKAEALSSVTMEAEASRTSDINVLTVTAVSDDSTVTVTAELQVQLYWNAVTPENSTLYKGSASVKDGGLEYKSYDISRSTPMEGGAGE